jgi:hypothetical protein
VIDVIAGMLIALFVGIVCTFAASQNNYDNGYCTALGGTRINTGICNVDGKVVTIK